MGYTLFPFSMLFHFVYHLQDTLKMNNRHVSWLHLLSILIKHRAQCYASLHCYEYGHLTTWNIRDADKTLYRDRSHEKAKITNLNEPRNQKKQYKNEYTANTDPRTHQKWAQVPKRSKHSPPTGHPRASQQPKRSNLHSKSVFKHGSTIVPKHVGQHFT